MELVGKQSGADAVDPGAPASGAPGAPETAPASTAELATEDTAAAEVPETAPAGPTRRRRRTLAFDLTALAVIGILLAGALTATGTILYQQLYSPSAFVLRYLDLLSQGRAADALAVPGVQVDSVELVVAGLPAESSEALLRREALAPLADIEVVGAVEHDDHTSVTVSYTAGPHTGTTTFDVERAGSVGLLPTWRFAETPLAVIDLTVRGSMQFTVNGFEIDKRQVSPDRLDADPLAPVPLLVFSPGLYSVSVQTAIAESPGVAVLSDSPRAKIPVSLQTEPTDEFVAVVQDEVEAFLTECATQQVLQPTACPFGFVVRNRIDGPPTWTIASQPTVALEPDGAGWAIQRTEGVAHLEVDIQSIFDGSITHLAEDVPFAITGSITILPDGTASIRVSPSD